MEDTIVVKREYLNKISKVLLAVYVLVYAGLIYTYLASHGKAELGYIVLGETAVIANVVTGVLLALIPSHPRLQITGGFTMVVIYLVFDVVYNGFSLSDWKMILASPAVILALPLLLPLVIGLVREFKKD